MSKRLRSRIIACPATTWYPKQYSQQSAKACQLHVEYLWKLRIHKLLLIVFREAWCLQRWWGNHSQTESNTRPVREKQGASLSLSISRQNLTHTTPSAMARRVCAFTPQGLQFPVLNLNSIHAEATCMVEKTCLYRSVDIDWHYDVWRPKNIFWMLQGQISPVPRSTWILFRIS